MPAAIRTVSPAMYCRLIAASLLLFWHLLSPAVSWADETDNDTPLDLSQLTLSKAEQLYTQNNRELLAAKRAVEGMQADSLSAAQKPNPTLSLNTADLKPTGGNGPGGALDKSLDSILRVDQTFERGNKRDLRIAAAKQGIQASQFDLLDTARQGKLGLRDAYYDLMLAQQTEQIQRDTQALYQKTLQASQLRLDAGDIAAADMARMRVDAFRAENDLRQAQADREKAQSALAYMIGKDGVARTIIAVDGWPAIEIPASLDAESTTFDQRPDVQAAQTRIKQAEENRSLAQALKTRDVTIGLQYEHYPTATGDTLGAGISIPLFTNYQYEGEIARSEVNFTSALEAEDQTRAQAQGEVARAKADLQSAIEKTNRYDAKILSEAQKAADAAEFAYTHGAMDVTDLLDSRRVLRALQLDAASVRADYAKSLAAWRAAINPEENP